MVALFDLRAPISPELLPHTVDVERQTQIGQDSSGGPIWNWQLVYQGLPCFITVAGAQEERLYAERGITASHRVYFGQQPDGTLPQLGIRDRLIFGQWTGISQPRRMAVQWVEDEQELGIVLTADVLERRPS